MVRTVFLDFIVVIVLIGFWLFLIPGFVSVNILLEFIVRENLWLLQVFFFYIYVSTSVLYVCVWVFVSIYTYIFSGVLYFLSTLLDWMWGSLFRCLWVSRDSVSARACVSVCMCARACVCVRERERERQRDRERERERERNRLGSV